MKKILFLLLISFSVQGQEDSMIVVSKVATIVSQRTSGFVGTRTQEWESEDLHSNRSSVSEALQSQTGVYLKNYGRGTLTTSSIRGGNASQTLVLWNEMPIQSPMLGLLDLALLSTRGIDRIRIHSGGMSSVYGSGAIGGVISLNNERPSKEGILASNQLAIGSFSALENTTSFSINSNRLSAQTNISYRTAENDFEYLSGNKIDTLTNAQQSLYSINQDFYYKTDKDLELELHYWGSYANRQIPPLVTQTESQAFQIDKAHRFNLKGLKRFPLSQLSLSSGVFVEHLDYYDPERLLVSESAYTTWLANGEYRHFLHENSPISILFGINHSTTKINAGGNYDSNPTEHRSALRAQANFNKKVWRFEFSMRQELVDGKLQALMPSLGSSLQANSELKINGKISRNYRLPSLNDRYWVPGGNIDLLPESGWSQELSVDYSFNSRKGSGASVVLFNRDIKNWIQWSREDGNFFFEAFNLTEVWSRGIQTKFNHSVDLGKSRLGMVLGVDYIKSTNQIDLEIPAIKAGDQIWYTPELSSHVSLNWVYKKFKFNYRHQWVDEVRGLNEIVQSFSTGDVFTSINLKKDDISVDVFLGLDNLWNTDYRVVERRPMPGRNYQLGLKMGFHQTKKNKDEISSKP